MKRRIVLKSSTEEIHINTDEIPDHVGMSIAQVLLEAILRDYNDPAVQEEFRRWKEERARQAI